MTTPDTVTRIDLPFLDCTYRRVDKKDECYLLLHAGHIEYKVKATYATDDNKEGIWKDVRSNYRWVRRKSALSDISMYFDNSESKWMVCTEFDGVADPTGWLYNNPKEALATFNKLKEYMISE